jgi:hypothetical protein
LLGQQKEKQGPLQIGIHLHRRMLLQRYEVRPELVFV